MPVFGPTGRFGGSITAVVDITDLQRTRGTLQRSEAALRGLLDEQEKERLFLCHEFHDGPIQYAVGGHMVLERLVERMGQVPEAEILSSALTLISRCIDDGRRVVERVRIAAGGCTITTAAGKGTTVSATLPVPDPVRTGTPRQR